MFSTDTLHCLRLNTCANHLIRCILSSPTFPILKDQGFKSERSKSYRLKVLGFHFDIAINDSNNIFTKLFENPGLELALRGSLVDQKWVTASVEGVAHLRLALSICLV